MIRLARLKDFPAGGDLPGKLFEKDMEIMVITDNILLDQESARPMHLYGLKLISARQTS
jgi:hypothetical protein